MLATYISARQEGEGKLRAPLPYADASDVVGISKILDCVFRKFEKKGRNPLSALEES
jgi:hypothetical protein